MHTTSRNLEQPNYSYSIFFGLTIGPLYHLKTESSGNVNCSIPRFSKEANVFEKLRFTLIEGVLLKVFLLRKKLLYLRGSGFRLISKLYYSKLFIRNRTWRYIDISIGPRRAFTVKKLSLFSIFKNLLGVLNFFWDHVLFQLMDNKSLCHTFSKKFRYIKKDSCTILFLKHAYGSCVMAKHWLTQD